MVGDGKSCFKELKGYQRIVAARNPAKYDTCGKSRTAAPIVPRTWYRILPAKQRKTCSPVFV